MITLAIDTSSQTASAALLDGYITLAESTAARLRTHSETLMPMIAHLFELTAMRLEDIDCIACSSGPGSFTGLRIGAACAKGLALAAEKPLIAVPTLDAMAYTMVCADAWVAPMLDARRGQVYTALYAPGGKRETDYLAEPIENILDMLKDKGRVICLGDGAEANRERIAPHTIAPQAYLRASAVGAVALSLEKRGESDFSLLYIRKPQAQREREERKCSQ